MIDKQTLALVKLVHDDEFARMCLLRLYQQQTADEQVTKDAHHNNRQGFTKADALVLSLYAITLQEGHELTVNEMADLHRRLPKYTKQLTTLLTDDEVE